MSSLKGKKKNSWNTVTPLSKSLAMVLFITLPFVGFYFGTLYQKKLDMPMMQKIEKQEIGRRIDIDEVVACTMDAKICPDGTAVGRSGPNCEFTKCPGE